MSRPVPDSYRQRLEHAKAASGGQLLLKSARLLNELAVARVRRVTGERRLRPSHTSIFPHLDLDGTRLTTLASRMGITKQAVSELIGDLEAMRLVERVPDPADGRARLIRFSRRGREGLMHGVGILDAIESEIGKKAGEGTVRHLREALAAILPVLQDLHARELGRAGDRSA
jgi:DNA-binding MarR family transcriptional regulator